MGERALSSFIDALSFCTILYIQGLVIRHEHCIVVAFRGTDEAADWLDNINALPVDSSFGIDR